MNEGSQWPRMLSDLPGRGQGTNATSPIFVFDSVKLEGGNGNGMGVGGPTILHRRRS